MLLSFVACSMSSPSTIVDEMRIMAIQSEPAEISPLDPPAQLQFLIANPQNLEVDVLYWTCTNLGEGCLEAYACHANLCRVYRHCSYTRCVFTLHVISLSIHRMYSERNKKCAPGAVGVRPVCGLFFREDRSLPCFVHSLHEECSSQRHEAIWASKDSVRLADANSLHLCEVCS